MNKVLLTSLAALALAGCSKTTSNLASTSPQVPSSKLVLTDASGCLLDEDCEVGLFCFQNRCTFECAADVPCGPGEHCSARGRCLSDAKEALVWKGTELTPVAWDEAEAAAAPGTAPISVLSPPPQEVQVIAGAPFVEVSLETSAPLPDGALLYRVALEGVSGTQQSLRATGSTRFTLTIPTGTAGTLDATPTVQRANVVTSVGAFAIALVPRRSVDGLYAGDVAVREFGGSSVPLRFGLRVVPSDATFEDAQQRFLILPASPQALFSPIVSNTEVWVERPLEFDTQSNVWFARFAAPFALDGNSQFGGDIVRTLRIELSGMEEGRLQGAVADRWLGLFAARTADGVPTPATVGLTGQLTATRVQALPAAARTPMQGNASATTPSLAAPLAITQCTSTVYGGLVAGTGQLTDAGVATGPCPGMTTPTAFTSAATEDKATCALALADKALAGPSTATQVLAFLDENTPNPGGLSFGEFLTKCAARDGYCVPTPEVLCANQLLAHAYQTQAAELTQAGVLLERYQRTAREVYLGRQLAAFQVDTNIRLEWLRTSEAPLFLASELKAYNEDILARWKTQVLDAHFDVLRSQFAPAGLEVLGRQPTDATALSVRGQMLLEQAQTWQGAMEALQIATTRWNSLYQDTSSRASATALVRSRMFDLYLSAAVLSQLNRASGASANSSIFGSGFAALMRSLEQLSLPFDSLIFMRDAEVVVNRSVDPSSSANTLLADRRELARRAVLDAQDSVDRVLADSRASEINAQVLTDRMITQAEELRSELVQVCGLPKGCTTTDFAARPECAVNVSVGSCGFVRAPNGGAVDPILAIAAEPSISEAGQAILAFRQSLIDQQIALEEFRGNQERAQIELDAAEGFAKKIESWDRQRRAVNTEVQTLLNEITSLNIEAMGEEIAGLKAMQLRREAAYDVQEAGVKSWAAIRYAGVTADMKKMTSINALNQTGAWLTRTADEVDHIAETTAEGFPKAVGLANDVSFAGRFIIGMSAFGVTSGLRAAATALDTAAASVELSLTEDRARREANLEELADLADLQVRQTENQLAEMSTQLRVHALQTEAAVAQREALIDALRRNLELDLARDRDLIELRDRRDKVRLRLADSSALQARVARAEVVATRHLLEYFEVVQRAQLLQGRYAALSARLENLNELIASPAVIFAFANRLARAESRVDRARTLLFDWLVALEYYAVRPFIDQRLAILLARNPSQLEAISNELVRLQNACGGNVNTAIAELSLRDDLLKVGFETETRTAVERFREVLKRGNVPIDTQVRYSTDQRIGDLLRSRKVLAATFTLSLDDFANLPQTCNSKVASLDVQLVGEGLGNARPTVSVLYDGTSTLRSCQPNIRDLVSALDPGTTSFGPLTRFRTKGRSVSPVASINTFGLSDSVNRGLEGLPLASTYTVLIDPEAGENKTVDWSRLEDVKLKLTWAYQDLFPVGQCQ